MQSNGQAYPPSQCNSVFMTLLEQLAHEHEKEIATLRKRVRELSVMEERPSTEWPEFSQPLVGDNLCLDEVVAASDTLNQDANEVLKLDTDKVLLSGKWIDQQGSFFGGVVISISSHHWAPQNPPGEMYQNSTYKAVTMSASVLKLIEERQDGSQREFTATLESEDTIQVAFGKDLKWILKRVGGANFALWPEWNVNLQGLELRTPKSAMTPKSGAIRLGLSKSRTRSLSKELGKLSQGLALRRVDRAIQQMKATAHNLVYWEILGFCLVCADFVWVPMTVFDPPVTIADKIWDWLSVLYWSIDFLRSFLIGYDGSGALVVKLKVVAINYIKSYFMVDLFCLCADWLLLLRLNEYGSSTRYMRVIRTSLKFRRILRVMHLDKMRFTTELATKYLVSERRSIYYGLLKLACKILLINHFIACMWYALGSSGSAQNYWVDAQGIRDKGMWQKYFLSLHWSLCQFTPASMTVHPNTFPERVFTVWTVLIGMASMSTLIGNYSALVTRLRTINSASFNDNLELRRFLRENGVSIELSSRINRYIGLVKRDSKARIRQNKVNHLRLLSGPLKMELQKEIVWPILKVHDFFRDYNDQCSKTSSRLCFMATSERLLSQGDILFEAAAVCEHMYFVTSGSLSYYYLDPRSDPASDGAELRELLEAATWCCEAVLWVPWVHCGTMATMVDGSVVSLESAKFRELSTQSIEALRYCKNYATAFLTTLNDMSDDVPLEFAARISSGLIGGI